MDNKPKDSKLSPEARKIWNKLDKAKRRIIAKDSPSRNERNSAIWELWTRGARPCVLAEITGLGTGSISTIIRGQREASQAESERPKDVKASMGALREACEAFFNSILAIFDERLSNGPEPGESSHEAIKPQAHWEYVVKEDPIVRSPDDVFPLVSDLVNKKQEHFVCISLDGAGRKIESRVITIGILNHAPVHPREVFVNAITDRASSVILVHNHPSGSLEPSKGDVEVTRQLVHSGSILGIDVLDHLIVSKRGYTSLKEEGLM